MDFRRIYLQRTDCNWHGLVFLNIPVCDSVLYYWSVDGDNNYESRAALFFGQYLFAPETAPEKPVNFNASRTPNRPELRIAKELFNNQQKGTKTVAMRINQAAEDSDATQMVFFVESSDFYAWIPTCDFEKMLLATTVSEFWDIISQNSKVLWSKSKSLLGEGKNFTKAPHNKL